MKLTKEQQTLKDIIEQCNVAYIASARALGSARTQCKHDAKVKSGESCKCAVCNLNLGWWCPETKGPCEYDDEHGENCIHCGEPDERK